MSERDSRKNQLKESDFSKLIDCSRIYLPQASFLTPIHRHTKYFTLWLVVAWRRMLIKKRRLRRKTQWAVTFSIHTAMTAELQRLYLGILTFYTQTTVCIFRILFSIDFLWRWQGRIVNQSKTSFVVDDFLYSRGVNVWFKGGIVRRSEPARDQMNSGLKHHQSSHDYIQVESAELGQFPVL